MHLVVGASGELGSRVALRLLDAGEPVRAVSRSPDRLQGLVDQGAEAVRGDLREEKWMAPALEGVRSVTLAAHGLVPPSRRNHPGVVDGVGTRRLIDAAQAAGVHHVVHLSAAGVEEQDTLFGKVKLETEAHLRRSGVPWTILRPTVFMENHALLLMGQPGNALSPGSGAHRRDPPRVHAGGSGTLHADRGDHCGGSGSGLGRGGDPGQS